MQLKALDRLRAGLCEIAGMRGARYARGFWRMPELHPHYGVKLAILRLITRLAMRPTQIDRPMKSR